MENETEVWLRHPEIEKIEVSSFGRVRTLDRIVPCRGNRTQFVKGRVLTQHDNGNGYLQTSFRMNRKLVTKSVHRLVSETFISNPDNLPQVNHKNCDRGDNRVSNLEWCDESYNQKYRNKHGVSQTEAAGHPLFAVNLNTLEVYKFQSQKAAGKYLGIDRITIIHVIKGRQRTAGGYWFVNADEKAVDVAKRKLREIGKTKLASADEAIAEFTRQVNSDCKIISE